MMVRRSSSTSSPSSRSATSSRVVLVPMSMTATGTSVEQLVHALHRPGEDRAIAPDDDGPLHELGVLRHEGDGLVVADVALAQAKLP